MGTADERAGRVTLPSSSSYVICVRNDGYPASLERGKVYVTLGPPAVGPKGYLAVVDESGEDYLFPASYFHAIELPQEVEEALAQASPAQSPR